VGGEIWFQRTLTNASDSILLFVLKITQWRRYRGPAEAFGVYR
jgi:hypothetical protein